MKRIKVAFVDFWKGFDPNSFICTLALQKKYNIEIKTEANDADYVFYSVFGDEHWFLPSEKIKILYTGEDLCPDFNACDYAIGFEWLNFGDRYLRLPNYYINPFHRKAFKAFETRYESPLGDERAKQLVKSRDFCSFVVSNGDGNPIRRQLFEALSQYKQVDSGGRWMNNVGGPVKDKISFESGHKFSIACENSSHSGYTTEKIIEAFAAYTIPIYWGDPNIDKVFNTKAFINVNDFPSLEAVVQRVIELDNSENDYIEMLKQQALLDTEFYSIGSQESLVLDFLQNVVEQPLIRAQRYNRDFCGKQYHERERKLIIKNKKTWKDLVKERFF